MRLRVASWNVQSFRGGVDAAVRVLQPLAVDLALLQECGPKRGLARFARGMGMEFVSSHRLLGRVLEMLGEDGVLEPRPQEQAWEVRRIPDEDDPESLSEALRQQYPACATLTTWAGSSRACLEPAAVRSRAWKSSRA